MNDSRTQRSGFAFYLQILLLLAVFLGVCTVLIGVFAGAVRLSRAAARQTCGTELCRNAAEAFAAAGTAEQTFALLGAEGLPADGTARFNGRLQPDANGDYCLTITVSEEKTGAGVLMDAHLAVTDQNGTLCAELDTQKYLPSGEGGLSDAA